LNPAVPSQQSSLALGVNMNQEKPLKATIPPHLNKKIDLTNQSIYISTGSLTNPHIAVSFCKQNDDVTRLVYDIACNGKTNLWITGNVWIGEDKIGNTSSNPMSCNKMPSATIERKTTSAMVYAQDVSRGNNDKTRARSRNSRCSVSGFLKDAISNIKPSLETRKKKIAGITRHVPSIVSPSRGEGLAIRWVLAAAKEKQRKGGKELSKCLSDELLDAYLKRGEARQKRDSLHKLAESNRSYVRYRWW
jgi:small subunit ribosomal protein S7